jgi:phosphopantothenoylcysteine decarboxylase / phosphopantothenate---cysteine ligase
VRFLITAGPTREPIDPVRYLSNRSSGKMGYAMAEAASAAGHSVTLISGPVSLVPPAGATLVQVTTSDEMHDAVQAHLASGNVLVMCAAVADYKPAAFSTHKIKKQKTALTLELIPTRDILASLTRPSPEFLVVGFAAETDDLEANAQKKLRHKKCDIIVANDVSGNESGMESDENEVIIFFRNGEKEKISRAPKKIIAQALVKIIANACEKRLTKKTR